MIVISFSIMVLIVCRNRRDTTLAAIERLKLQRSSAQVSIAVFDDASTDGTPEAILQRYPDVQIVHGDGRAFWNGGLHQLWSAVQKASVDAFLWLNDDTYLDRDAVGRLVAGFEAVECEDKCAILVGATRGLDGEVSYSGYDVARTPLAFKLKRVRPDADDTTKVATFNGNVVLVGRGAVSKIGLNDPQYFHNLGDVDYGLRAQRAGIPILLLPGTLGVCESNAAKRDRGYGSPRLSLREQWRKVNSHHGLPFRSWWRFTRRHSGRWWPLHFMLPYRHLLRFWRLRSRA